MLSQNTIRQRVPETLAYQISYVTWLRLCIHIKCLIPWSWREYKTLLLIQSPSLLIVQCFAKKKTPPELTIVFTYPLLQDQVETFQRIDKAMPRRHLSIAHSNTTTRAHDVDSCNQWSNQGTSPLSLPTHLHDIGTQYYVNAGATQLISMGS